MTSMVQQKEGEKTSLLELFYVQHIIKPAPCVIVPNQSPFSSSLLLLRGYIPHQDGDQLASVCNSKAEKRTKWEEIMYLIVCLFQGDCRCRSPRNGK